jgi:hypothetical protein
MLIHNNVSILFRLIFGKSLYLAAVYIAHDTKRSSNHTWVIIHPAIWKLGIKYNHAERPMVTPNKLIPKSLFCLSFATNM